MEYTYEKLAWSCGGYQVRLNGEFIMYVDEIDDSVVDEVLEINGFESREAYFNYITSD